MTEVKMRVPKRHITQMKRAMTMMRHTLIGIHILAKTEHAAGMVAKLDTNIAWLKQVEKRQDTLEFPEDFVCALRETLVELIAARERLRKA